jgi:dipeptidyl aminopeptidase/acylaminoacyl peptidase
MRPLRAALVAGVLASNVAHGVVPVEAFAAREQTREVVISPDGSHLALNFRKDLRILKFPSMEAVQAFSFPEGAEPSSLSWAGAGNLLVVPVRGFSREFQSITSVPAGQIMRAEVGRKSMQVVWPPRDRGAFGPMGRPPAILPMRSPRANHVVVSQPDPPPMMRGGEPGGVFHLDVRNGRMARESAAPLPLVEYVFGPGEKLALASGVNDRNEAVVFQLTPDPATRASTWVRKLAGPADQGRLRPVAWTGQGEEYYALDNRDAATTAVVAWDAASGHQRLLYRHADVDMEVGGVDASGRVWLFQGSDHYPVYWYPDPEHPLARAHRQLTASVPNARISITSHTDDLSLAVARIESAELPTMFLVIQTNGARVVQQIPGWAELPPGMATVASRGYAVLQVNFRGSGGRGRDFQQAGQGEWGRRMADDLIDAVRWAIKDGVADADKVCIVGARLGATAAFAAAAREPSLFRCVAGLDGIYDLAKFFNPAGAGMGMGAGAGAGAMGPSLQALAVGENRAEVERRSPLGNAAAIQARVLMVHSKSDFQAPLAQATAMRDALAAGGQSPELVVAEDGAGILSDQERAATYRRLLEFLDRATGS